LRTARYRGGVAGLRPSSLSPAASRLRSVSVNRRPVVQLWGRERGYSRARRGRGTSLITQTILVTGGAGFIGSHFARHLYNKYPEYRILVLDALTYAGSVTNLPDGARQSDRYEFWYGDVRNGELIDTLVSRADVIVHMAAESHVTRSIYDNRLFFDTDV